MAYCNNCGQKNPDGAAFCSACGQTLSATSFDRRQIVYDGEIHKCPYCGDVIHSFSARCPSCGNEIRGIKNNKTVQEFASDIQNCHNDINSMVDIIRVFPIPNTSEDLMEFLLLAKSNILNADRNSDGALNEDEKLLLNAWLTKLDQCHSKLDLLSINDNFQEQFNYIYTKTKQLAIETADKLTLQIKEQKRKEDQLAFKSSKSKIIIIIGLCLSILFTLLAFTNYSIFSGILAILSICGFVFSWLLGAQIIDLKVKIKKIHILTIILSFLLFIPYFLLIDVTTDSYLYDNTQKVCWEEILLEDKIPHGKINKIRMFSNENDSLRFYAYNFTEEQYANYLQLCKDFGYTIDARETENSYESYNVDGYKLYISFLSYSKELQLILSDPVKANNILWPNSPLLSNVPIPKSLIGEVLIEGGKQYAIRLLYLDKAYYNEYVDLCMSNGFNVDYQKYENVFRGTNEQGITINVEYEGLNIIFIEVVKRNVE